MTESPDTGVHQVGAQGLEARVVAQNTRLYQVLAWVGIIAGVLFITGAVFIAGFFAGGSGEGDGWHRGYENAEMGPDGKMGGCPMMQKQPGGMGGMGSGNMGPGEAKGPTTSSTMPMPPGTGQR